MAMIDAGKDIMDEKDTDTFLTGTNVEEKKNQIDNFENSQALVE